MHYAEIFPQHSNPEGMTLLWWARFGLEEAALDDPRTPLDTPLPAHDRLAALERGEAQPVTCVCSHEERVHIKDAPGGIAPCPSCWACKGYEPDLLTYEEVVKGLTS